MASVLLPFIWYTLFYANENSYRYGYLCTLQIWCSTVASTWRGANCCCKCSDM